VEAVSTQPVSPGGARRRSSRRGKWFFVWQASAVIAAVLLGFAPSYYLVPFTGAPSLGSVPVQSIPFYVHVHAAVMTAWVSLLLTQALLVANGRTNLHRRLGLAGGALAAGLMFIGVVTAILGFRRLFPLSAEGAFLTFTVGVADLLTFSLFVGAGLYFRRLPALHKRLMMLGTISLILAPALGRIAPRLPTTLVPVLIVAGPTLLFAGPLSDVLARRKVYWTELCGGLAILIQLPFRGMLAMTHAWQQLVIRLLL
jgi:hypothetical protein